MASLQQLLSGAASEDAASDGEVWVGDDTTIPLQSNYDVVDSEHKDAEIDTQQEQQEQQLLSGAASEDAASDGEVWVGDDTPIPLQSNYDVVDSEHKDAEIDTQQEQQQQQLLSGAASEDAASDGEVWVGDDTPIPLQSNYDVVDSEHKDAEIDTQQEQQQQQQQDEDTQQEDNTQQDGSTGYSAEVMRAKLAVIPLEGKNIDEVTVFVQTVCREEGVEVAVASSRKSKDAGARLLYRQLKCKHGLPNRQKEHQLKDAPNSAKKRKSESGRTGCPFSVTIRWPTRGEGSEHPYLSEQNTLTHNHQVDKDVVEVARRLRQPLDSPMKALAAKLTGAGVKPADQARVLQALHGKRVNARAIQNEASRHGRRDNPWDANELLEKVKEATADGGVYHLKMDTEGRLTHIFWMTATQVSLSAQYGHVLLYDDTAVKNKFRLPQGIGVVIDGEYFSRIVFQMLASDTRADTFEWMLGAWKDARGGAPEVFIQDADGACTQAVDKVYPEAKKLRCLWHLGKNVLEKCRPLLRKDYPAFRVAFHKMRGRLSEEGFEESFEELITTFPKVEVYMRHLHKDRERWAACFSVLTFSVASFTTNRVEGLNQKVKKVCNALTSLCGVFEFLDETVERQEERAQLRSALLSLPSTAPAHVDEYWFGKTFMAPLRYGLGKWPYRFMQQEMEAAAIFCGGGGGHAVLEGDARSEALGNLEFIGTMVVNVETVAVITESRNGKVMRYIVCSMADGSHVCSCRTLQELGLCCRHFWQAMLLSADFKFHIGILHKHWVTAQGLRELETWPVECRPKWMVALNHRGSNEDQVRAPTEARGGTWQAIPENLTIESRLQEVKQKGPSHQDRRVLYVEMLKMVTSAVSAGVQTVPPETLRAMVETFERSVNAAGMISSGQGAVLGNPLAVRQPAARSEGSRARSAVEFSGAASRRSAQSYNS